jgi:hypothetical protein
MFCGMAFAVVCKKVCKNKHDCHAVVMYFYLTKLQRLT